MMVEKMYVVCGGFLGMSKEKKIKKVVVLTAFWEKRYTNQTPKNL